MQAQNNSLDAYRKHLATLRNIVGTSSTATSNVSTTRSFGRDLSNNNVTAHPQAMVKPGVSTFNRPTTSVSTYARPMSTVDNVAVMRQQNADAAARDLAKHLDKFHIPEDTKSLLSNSMVSRRVDADIVNDPQHVAEYVDDIFDHYRKTEGRYRPAENFLSKQTEITEKMRGILVDWLVEVHLKFRLLPATLFLTVDILDRYLEINQVPRSKLQLVGVTSMLIAAKYEEIYPPEVRDFVYVSDRAYQKNEIIAMEALILNKLKFNVTVPTVFAFSRRFGKANKTLGGNTSDDSRTKDCMKYLIELALTGSVMYKFLPSEIAASSIFLANKMSSRSPSWTEELTVLTKYNENSMQKCVSELAEIARSSSASSQTTKAVFKKYSVAKMSSASSLPVPVL